MTTSESEESGEAGLHTEEKSDELSKTEIFDILSADRRQQVLQYLHRHEGEADIGELAERIASVECNCSVSELGSQQRKRTYVGLYQCHLPKMEKAGVIDYDADRGAVSLNERSHRLLNYIYLEEQEHFDEEEGFLGRLLR